MFPPQPSAHAAGPSPADSADEGLIPRFSHHAALDLCNGDTEASLLRPGAPCLSSSPSPPIVRPQPACMLAAVTDALLGMVDFDLLRLLLPQCRYHNVWTVYIYIYSFPDQKLSLPCLLFIKLTEH
jgi:hypothetical protein